MRKMAAQCHRVHRVHEYFGGKGYQCTVPKPIVSRLGPKDRITFKV